MATMRYLSANELEDELVAVRTKVVEAMFALNEALELIKGAEPSLYTDVAESVRFRRAIERGLSNLAADIEELARQEQPEVTAGIVFDELDELLDLVRAAKGGDDDAR